MDPYLQECSQGTLSTPTLGQLWANARRGRDNDIDTTDLEKSHVFESDELHSSGMDESLTTEDTYSQYINSRELRKFCDTEEKSALCVDNVAIDREQEPQYAGQHDDTQVESPSEEQEIVPAQDPDESATIYPLVNAFESANQSQEQDSSLILVFLYIILAHVFFVLLRRDSPLSSGALSRLLEDISPAFEINLELDMIRLNISVNERDYSALSQRNYTYQLNKNCAKLKQAWYQRCLQQRARHGVRLDLTGKEMQELWERFKSEIFPIPTRSGFHAFSRVAGGDQGETSNKLPLNLKFRSAAFCQEGNDVYLCSPQEHRSGHHLCECCERHRRSGFIPSLN